jgi:hypothetical protein
MAFGPDITNTLPYLDPQSLGAEAFQQSQPDASGQTPPGDTGPNIQALLKELMQPVPQAPKIHPGRVIVAAIADAMMAKARVLSGGQPGEGAASGAIVEEQRAAESQRRDIEAQNRAVKVELTKDLIRGKMESQRQHQRDLFMAQQKAAEQDRKDAADKDKQEREDREDRRKLAIELIGQRRLKASDVPDPNNPPDWGTLTRAAGISPTPDAQSVEALRSLVRPGEQATISVPAAGQPTAQISEEKPEKPEKGAKEPLDGVSMATMLTNTRATGEDFSDLTDDPGQKALLNRTAVATQKKLAQIPAATQRLISPQLTGEALAERMIMMLIDTDGTPNDIFGPGSVKLDITQGEARETFRKAADNLGSAFLLSRSGAAVSDAEYARLKSTLPGLNRIHLNNVTALRELLTYFRTNTVANTPAGKEDGVEALRKKVRKEAMSTFGLRPTDRVLVGVSLDEE